MVIWSEPAKEDLRTIYEYIAHDSPVYAHQVVNNIIEKSETLKDFPAIGRIVPETNDDDIRELIIYSYRIIYENAKNDSIIHAVIHGKKDFNNSFEYSK
jgi:addiction module RelE/StbE family toxin